MSSMDSFATQFFTPISLKRLSKRLSELTTNTESLLKTDFEWEPTINRTEFLKNSYNRELLNLSGGSILNPKDQRHIEPHVTKVNHLEAMLKSIETQPLINFVAKQKFGEKLKGVKATFSELKKSCSLDFKPSKKTESLLQESDQNLRKIAMDSNRLLASIERETTSELLKSTLSSMGYDLRSKENMILAGSGETSIRARIMEDSTISIDTTSFKGLTCHREMAKLQDQLKRQGVQLMSINHCRDSLRNKALLTDPFPKLNQAGTQIKDSEIQTENAQSNLSQTTDYLTRARQFQHQSLKLKEGLS